MASILNFLSFCFVFVIVNGKKFGYEKRYTCHCTTNYYCDEENGRCRNNGCIEGWFGPNCQKENVALRKRTTQSSQYVSQNVYQHHDPGLVVDGNTYNQNDANCSHTAQPTDGTSFWQVDLGETYPIREIQIYLRDDFAERLRGYFIDMFFLNGSSTPCKSQSSENIPGLQFTIDVNCKGRYLRISNNNIYNKNAHVNLCEVEIYVCAPGTYGSNCDNFCYCKSAEDRCIDGVCPSGCVPGYKTPSCSERCYGFQCQSLCSTRKCQIQTNSCDIFTGSCAGECQIGYQTPDCQSLCSAGTYGDQCLKQCSDRHCINSDSCDPVTGDCVGGCLDGYMGPDCTEECSDGRYGRNCQHYCRSRRCKDGEENSSCDSKSGKCDSGCTSTYKPPNCIETCDYNTNYGDQCSRNCSDRHCYYPRSACDYITGNCYNSLCNPGYKPGDCYEKCDTGIIYGTDCRKVCSQRNCSDTSSSSCDHVTGLCDDGCKPGYRLEDCSAKCSDGYYGKGCKKKCSKRNCNSYSTRCDYISGECTDGCRNNYVGIDCTQKCSPGSYGDGCSKQCQDRQCKEIISELCEKIDGTCTDRCKPGYMGYDCTQQCKSGYYGENCNKSCQVRHCNNERNDNDVCNPQTGACDQCLPGYTGIDCITQCTDRKYGIDCQFDCDNRKCINKTRCDFMSGICDGGCLDGFANEDCVRQIQKKEDIMSIGAIVGIIVAVLCFIIMAGIIFIVFRKRRTENKYDKPEETLQKVVTYNQKKEEETGPIYENSTSVQNSKFETMPQKASDKTTNSIDNRSKTLKPTTNGGKDSTTKVKNIDLKKNTDSLKSVEIENQEVKTGDVNQKENIKNIKTKQDTGNVNSDDVYYNLETPAKTNVLQIKKLKEHVARLKNLKTSFNDIYQKLPSGFTTAYETSQIEENKPKNRFKGYYPYDYNRVVLNKYEDDPNSDYINASYVDYKCERYWPLEEKEDFGNITIKKIDENIRSYYVKRKLALENKKNGEVHETTQFHFTAWLDHDVPRIDQLLDFLYHVEDQKNTNTPVMVHCSAGIGRTGTYIAIDSLLKESRQTGKIDIQLRVKKMREQRKDMIQTSDQLKFVYEALAGAFESGRTDVTVEKYEQLLKSENKSFSLSKLSRTDELKLLQDTENKVEKSRIFIEGYPNITVYRAMSWKNSRGYDISDLTGHTKESIWKLIVDEECKTVVYFNEKATTLILPDSNQEEIGKYKLSSSSPTKLHDAIQLYTIQIQSGNVDKECKILIVQTKKVHDNSLLTSVLTELVYQVGLLDTSPTPVAVFYQSVKLVSKFCITKNIMERIKDDNEVEILNSTRQILEILPNAVNNMEDYNVLYDTTSSYIDSQNVYENL